MLTGAPNQRNPVFDCAVGFDIDDLTSKNTFIRFRGMQEDDYIPVSSGNAYRKELLEAGLIVEEKVETCSKLGEVVNTRLTPKGRGALLQQARDGRAVD